MTNPIKIKKLHDDAKLPHRAHHNDAGADLFALEDTVIPPGKSVKIRTGVAAALADNTAGLIWGKSSVESMGLKIMAGLIDVQYRGEILVCMFNLTDKDIMLEKGRKIAQLVICPVFYPSFEEAKELDETKRGSGGFGSTGG